MRLDARPNSHLQTANRLLLSRHLIPIIVACFGAVPSLQAQADSAADVRKSLRSLYDQSCAAIGRKDVIAADAIDTSDYVLVDDKGAVHTLAEARQRAVQMFRRQQIVKLTVHIDKITFTSKNVIADVTQHLYMKFTNPKTQHVFVTDQTATTSDTWIKLGKSWRRSRGQSRSVHVTVNGKIVYSSATAK